MTAATIQRSLKVNIAANVVGRFYTAVAGVVFVPVYLHFLGVEAYGLFALLNSYMAIAGLLDLGFSAAITRELAKLSSASPDRMRDLIWTISLPYWLGALGVGFAIYFSAPWIAAVAIGKGSSVPDPVILRAVGLAGFGLTLQLPVFLYSGGLAGLQRQDIANGITIASTTLRHGVSILLLWCVSDSVVTLMAWQAVIAALTAAVAFVLLWTHTPSNHRRPRFQANLLQEMWRFAAGLGSITVLGTIAFQSDKIIIGALLPLADVGPYMVASVIGSNLLLIAQPVVSAAFPRLALLMALKDRSTTMVTFEKLSQLVTVMVLPLATTIAVFPKETLMLWTGNPAIADSAAVLLRYFAVAVCLNAFTCLPYGLIMATGRTWQLFIIAVITCAITIPLVYFATAQWGSVGAALAMCSYRLIGFVFIAAILRPALGWKEWLRWLNADVVVPQALIGGIALLILVLSPSAEGRVQEIAILSLTWLASSAAAGLALPWIRHQAFWQWQQMRSRMLGSAL